MKDNTNPFPPACLEDIVLNDDTSREMLQAIVYGRLPFPCMGKVGICLWGVHGTGKTTLATLLPTLLEKSAKLPPSTRKVFFKIHPLSYVTPCRAGNNSVNLINLIDNRCQSDNAGSDSGWHYEVLDEADMLTKQAQLSLKATMTHAKSSIFIFTTNSLNQLETGIIDRCFLVEMNQPTSSAMLPLARKMLRAMSVDETAVPDTKLLQLAELSRGSVRDFGTAVITCGIIAGGVMPKH